MIRPLRASAFQRVLSIWSSLKEGIFSRGAVSLLLAAAGINASNFIFHVLVSRLLGPSHYGVVGALLSILSLVAVPIGAVQIAVTQAVVSSEERQRSFSLRRVTWRAFLGGVIAMLIFASLAPTLKGFLHIGTTLPLLLVSLWIPMATTAAVLQGALIGEFRFRSVAFATFFGGGPVRLIAGAGLAYAGFGATGAVVATLLAQGFVTGSLIFSSRQVMKSHHEGVEVNTSARDMVLSVAALSSFTALIGIDTFLARHFLPPAAAGEYAAGAIAAHIALFVPGAIITVAFPHFVDGKGVSASSRKAFAQSVKMTAGLGLVVAMGLAVLSSFVVKVLFGPSYSGAATIVGLLASTSVVIGLISLVIYLHLARRSLAAVTPWLGVGLAALLISLDHQTMTSVALIMLVVSLLTLIVVSIPAIRALEAAAASDASESNPRIELPPAEVDLTLVVPFFNPGSRLGKHVAEVVDVLSQADISYEIVAVSDGSTDHSEEQLAEIHSDRLTVVLLEQNQGKGAALRAGLSKGRGEYLGFIDGDGDLPASILIECLNISRRDRPDIIFGSKRHPQSQVIYPPLRRLYSWGYQQLNRMLFHLPIRDTQTGVKFIRRDVLAAVLPLMVEKRFAFDLELFVVAQQQGFRNFVEIPVSIGQRFSSTVSIQSVKHMIIDTLAIVYRLRVLRFYERDVTSTIQSLNSPSNCMDDLTNKSSFRTASTFPQPPLRILILNWRDFAHPNAGGAEVYTHGIADAWVNSGHDVTLFCAAVGGSPAREDVEGVHIIRHGNRYSVYRAAKRYYQQEGRGNFDLVVDEVNTRPFLTPKWIDDTKVVVLIHQVCRELWYYQLPFVMAFVGRYWFEPRWLRMYRDVPTVTVSESSKESLMDYGLNRIVTIPEGSHSIAEHPNVERETLPTVIFIGRLEAHKRPEEAIEAFKLLRETLPSAQMWVVGTGPMEGKLRRLAPPGVTFLGRVSNDEKIARLARAHVLVATSVREGWGLIVTEAAAVGTPTIAYDVPGLRDSVRASNGFLTDPSPAPLSIKLLEMLTFWSRNGLPQVSPGGVISWQEVADRLIVIGMSESEISNVFPGRDGVIG